MNATTDVGTPQRGPSLGRLGPPRPLTGRLAFAADLVLIAGASVLAALVRFGPSVFPASELNAVVIGSLVAAQILPYFGLYDDRQPRAVAREAPRLLAAWALVLALTLAILYATKTSEDLSRLWVGYWFLAAGLALLASRLFLRSWTASAQRVGRLQERVVVVGREPLIGACLAALDCHQDRSIKVVGYLLVDEPTPADEDCSRRLFHDFGDLERFLTRGGADQVLLALPWTDPGAIDRVIHQVQHIPVEVALFPDLGPLAREAAAFRHMGGVRVVRVLARPLDGWNFILKEVQDRIVAAAALLVAAPVLLLIAGAVRLTSAGPVLFKQKRYGLNQEVIEVYKFRSMYVDQCDGATPSHPFRQVGRNDQRVTPVGRLIRRTSLDELPQLFNVLKGEMSIVGPRPHPLPLDDEFRAKIQDYVLRHRVKPGITGWAQVNGLRGETENEHKMQMRVEHDIYYVNNWSLMLDLSIILRTLVSILFGRNAY